jgi:hypothetical protein
MAKSSNIKIHGPISFFLRLRKAAEIATEMGTEVWFPKPYNGACARDVTTEVPLSPKQLNALAGAIGTVIADHEKAIEQLRADRESLFQHAEEQGFLVKEGE